MRSSHANQRSIPTHHSVNAEDSTNIHTSVDVAATVEWIEHNAVFASLFLLNDDRVVEFFGNEHSSFPRRPKRVDHDII